MTCLNALRGSRVGTPRHGSEQIEEEWLRLEAIDTGCVEAFKVARVDKVTDQSWKTTPAYNAVSLTTTDQVEAEGVRRARATLTTADLVLLVIDSTQPLQPQLALRTEVPDNVPCIEVYNKIDATGGKARVDDASLKVWVSAKTGQGLQNLTRLVKNTVGANVSPEGVFSARTRHLDALRRTLDHIETGRVQLEQYNAPETLAEELRLAQKALGEITGEYLPDDLLGAIFSSFCIGK